MKSIRDIFRNRLGMNKIYAKNFINHNHLQIFYIVINSMILIIQEHFFLFNWYTCFICISIIFYIYNFFKSFYQKKKKSKINTQVDY